MFALLVSLVPVAAQASPNPHDIILKLANESFVPQTSGKIQFLAPKGWTIHVDKDDLSFHVPYHRGVLGHIIQNIELTPDVFLKGLEKTYHAEMSEISQAESRTDHLQGVLRLLSGQFGGETYTILLFSGKFTDDNSVIYYAIAPSHWFQSYEPLFLDILRSIHK